MGNDYENALYRQDTEYMFAALYKEHEATNDLAAQTLRAEATTAMQGNPYGFMPRGSYVPPTSRAR